MDVALPLLLLGAQRVQAVQIWAPCRNRGAQKRLYCWQRSIQTLPRQKTTTQTEHCLNLSNTLAGHLLPPAGGSCNDNDPCGFFSRCLSSFVHITDTHTDRHSPRTELSLDHREVPVPTACCSLPDPCFSSSPWSVASSQRFRKWNLFSKVIPVIAILQIYVNQLPLKHVLCVLGTASAVLLAAVSLCLVIFSREASPPPNLFLPKQDPAHFFLNLWHTIRKKCVLFVYDFRTLTAKLEHSWTISSSAASDW